jgi:hypothetical protein
MTSSAQVHCRTDQVVRTDSVDPVKVLVLGSGAPEHALLLALSDDPSVEALICAPGNAGAVQLADDSSSSAPLPPLAASGESQEPPCSAE